MGARRTTWTALCKTQPALLPASTRFTSTADQPARRLRSHSLKVAPVAMSLCKLQRLLPSEHGWIPARRKLKAASSAGPIRLEVDLDIYGRRYGTPVDTRRRVDPPFHCVNRGTLEERRTAHSSYVMH